jgi:hypothetical protein
MDEWPLSHVTYWNEAIIGMRPLWKTKWTIYSCKASVPCQPRAFSGSSIPTKTEKFALLMMVIPSLELHHVPSDALSIWASFVPVGSVRLELWDMDGSCLHCQIENYEPYALFADSEESIMWARLVFLWGTTSWRQPFTLRKVPRVTSWSTMSLGSMSLTPLLQHYNPPPSQHCCPVHLPLL